jgi:acetyl-CoA acyltransferase
VGGVTVNRFCASGLTALQMAADRIRVGEADVMIAGGAESMSLVPMGGNKPSFNPEVFAKDENVGIAYGMGLTAEKVATQWKVSREAQDAFALQSHQRALAAIQAGAFCRRDDAGAGGVAQPDLAGRRQRQGAHGQHRRRPAPRHQRWKAWPSSSRCSPPRAASPPATAARPATAPVR